VSRPQDRDGLDEAISHLRKSLNPEFWIDETHLHRKHGEQVFNAEKEAVEALAGMMKDPRCTVPDSVLRGFIDRIVRADRLLAVVAIQDAAKAGADQKKLAPAREQVAKGDEQAARAKYDAAIDHYRAAWHHALHLTVHVIGRVVRGGLHLEFSAFPGETYAIEASTNLTDWITLGIGKVSDDGLVRFEDAPSGKFKVRFYRAKLLSQ